MATLKISDLAVGDWVQDGNGIIAKVRGIENWSNGCILNVQTVSGSICTLSATGALPIPITAEILEKNGFECIEEDADTVLYGTPSCSIFHTKGTLRYRLDTPQASVVCWNIHGLQHALRLAGVDKEIVMPNK